MAQAEDPIAHLDAISATIHVHVAWNYFDGINLGPTLGAQRPVHPDIYPLFMVLRDGSTHYVQT